MSELPFFTVVIPTYNRSNLIEKTIRSVLSQSFTDFELLVVDDGSTDQTESVVKSISDSRLVYYKKENAERAAARNFGAKHAKGQYVTFLDSDDLFFPNHLSEAYSFINKNSNPPAFFQAYELQLHNNTKKISFEADTINQLLSTKGNIMSCQGVFLKQDVAKKNLFNEDRALSGSEDFELWLRLASKYPILHNPIITSALIHHDNRSVLNIDVKNIIKRKDLFLKYTLENPEVRAFIGKNIRPFKAEAYSYVALHLVLARYKKEGLKYWAKALVTCPRFLFTRRNLSIIKHLLFKS